MSIFNETLTSDVIRILGNFNAEVGKDNDTWASMLRKFGNRKKNRNGQRLLEFVAANDMVIADLLFYHPNIQTCYSSDGFTWTNRLTGLLFLLIMSSLAFVYNLWSYIYMSLKRC